MNLCARDFDHMTRCKNGVDDLLAVIIAKAFFSIMSNR